MSVRICSNKILPVHLYRCVMLLWWYQVVSALLIVFFTVVYVKKYNFMKKLRWVHSVPGYPLIGTALQLRDRTKILENLSNYLTEHNGLCYMDVGSLPVLFVSNIDFLKWFLSSNQPLTKSFSYEFLRNWLGGGLLISGGEEWRRSRKILTPAFHFSVLERFIEVFEKNTIVLVRILDQEVGKDEVDIHHIVTRYTLDVITQTSMGVQMNIQDQKNTDYINAVVGMGQLVMERTFNPLKTFDFIYKLTADYRQETTYVKLLHEVSEGVINRRKKEIDAQNKDEGARKRKMAFLDLLLKYRDENGQPLSKDFIRNEVDTFMFAGHDTTASALGFAMYLLAKHPDVQAEAYIEVKPLKNTSKITIEDLQKLKYLGMVIKETLRLYPSVPLFARQMTEDLVYEDDKILPKGLIVLVVVNSLNRDRSVYDKPDEFIPSRFLDGQSKPFSYLSFSAGHRNCIGQKFALLELKMALAMILLNFKLFPANPPFEPIVEAATVLKSQNGVKIRLERRSSLQSCDI